MAALLISLRIIWMLLAVGIIVTVLLHAAKGDGVAAIGGSAQLFSSQKSAESNLDRVTWSLVIAFLLLTTVLSAGWLDPARVAQPTPTTGIPTAPQPTPAIPQPLAPTKK